MSYGVGRVPKDVDQGLETMAELEAAAAKATKRLPDYPKGRRLDCGCTVYYANQVMNANLGSSCAACYDHMSD